MAYSSRMRLQKAIDDSILIQLTDDKDTNIINWGIIDGFRTDADSLLDGYIGGRQSVPLSPVPAIIDKFSDDILIYYLYSRRGGAPPHIKENYDNAIKFMEGYAAGKNSLGTDDPADESGAGDIQFSYNTRTFTRSTMGGF